MLENIIYNELFNYFKKEYNITKYENEYNLQEKMKMSMFVKENKLEVLRDRKSIVVKKEGKIIASADIIYSNLISKYNNRSIPKAKLNIIYY